MNIGSLYLVKDLFWLLFQTKEAADRSAAFLVERAVREVRGADMADEKLAMDYAAYWSRQYNCEVTYFSPNEYIVFLEEEGKLKKVLTADGRIGWTWFDENYNDYFEEVKAE